MNGMTKAAIIAIGTVLVSDALVKQFTSETDSDTEKLIWRVGAAAGVGVALSKFL